MVQCPSSAMGGPEGWSPLVDDAAVGGPVSAWAVGRWANRRTRRSRLHVRLRTRSSSRWRRCVESIRTGRDHRPVDPTLLVGVVSQEWVSVVPAVGGKRRCPPSDTHFPDHHAWSWSDAARENGAPPQLRCQLCPGTVEPGEEECFNHSGTDQLGFVDAVVVPPAPRWRRASSTGKARIQVYSPACAPASSAMGMESKKMTGIGSDSQRT